ncbi:MAG: hypothetical protein WCK91_01010 [bacterium]
MFGLFGKSGSEGDTVAIFDIGTASIGGAIVQIPKSGEKEKDSDHDKLPTILKSVRIGMKLAKRAQFERLVEVSEKTLIQVSKKLFESKVAIPSHIYIVLSSPWYISETRIIKIAREHPFVFTKHLADELLTKEIASLTTSYQKKYEDTSGPEIIEHHIMSVTANGYPCAEPLGVSSKSIEMNMIVSLSPKVFLERMRESMSHTFPHAPVHFSSFAISSYLAISRKYVDSDSFILLDVAGELTDLSVITSGVFKTSLSFPFGKNTVLRHIASALKVDFRDAEELVGLYLTKTLEEKKLKKVEPAIKSAEHAWSKLFQECINSLRRTLNLPDTVFLAADTDALSWFANILHNAEYLLPDSTSRNWKIVTLDGPQFLGMCKVVDGPCDQFLMIEAIAVSRQQDQ